MEYLFLIIILYTLLVTYFVFANKYNIVDKPNERSAHSETTLQGGGIIIWFAALFYFLQNWQNNYIFFICISILTLVSFWDDIKSLPNSVRFLIHLIAITLILNQEIILHNFSLWKITLIFMFSIGFINAYNFMDGINGITGLYTIAVMIPLFYINEYVSFFVDPNLIIYPAIASLIFLFFNFRKKAKCFAGDVGSITIAFWVLFLLIKLIVFSGSLVWILLLALYGVDTVCTILHRLYLKQNIFKAHKLHFYQILSNEYKMDHREVSAIYALVQLTISWLVITMHHKINNFNIFFYVLLPLILLYCLKFYLLEKKSNIHKAKIN